MSKPITNKSIKLLSLVVGAALLSSCGSSVQPMGEIGPNRLKVFSITHSTFLNSSQMLLVLDKKGDVTAYTGGSSSGWGTVGLETTTGLASAGAIVYGANAVKNGLQSASVNVKGVPSKVDVSGHGTLDVVGRVVK